MKLLPLCYLYLYSFNIQQFCYYKYCRAYCSGDHYLIGEVFQGSLYTDPTMLLDAWTTYDEPLLCKIHENIKNLSLRGMNIELSKLHEGVEISTLKCAV